MPEFLRQLISPDFMPHGYCLHWDPLLLTLLIAGNLGIAAAYFAIPALLRHFMGQRKDLPYAWIFGWFAVFIFACGTSHIIKVVTIYYPVYWVEAVIDDATAIISLITAVLLFPLIPKALALKSPAALEETNQKLEVANEKLTSANEELAKVNADLQQTRDEALSASNLKSAFVANISHELRTPLSGVLGMNELLLRTRLDSEQIDYANAVQNSASSLMVIVNDILDLSRIEAGKMTLDVTELRPLTLVQEAVHLLSIAAEAKNLNITIDFDNSIPGMLYGDPIRIKQVLVNLLGNAIKFTSKGEISVRLVLVRADEKSLTIKFSVTDTGIGLSKDEQRFLFLPFTQVDSSTTRPFGGTGLGLALSKRLVELMEGEIGLVSEKGRGSSFWFTLPLKRKVSDGMERNVQATSGALTIPKGWQILVVEDNPILQSLALKQLNTLGIVATAVTTGEDAIEQWKKNDYGLILLDCNLPKMDGYSVARKIREAEQSSNNHVSIVAMTAGAMRGDSEKCLAAGMDDYLSKPYTLGQLKHKLHQWMPAVSKR